MLHYAILAHKNPKQIEGVKWVSGEPEEIVKELEKMGYESAILGGGAYVNGLFLKKKLIDEIYVTIEPKIFGEGLSLFSGDFDINLELAGTEKISDNSIVLKYKVTY
jgi:dihydrofolate reductase